MLQIDHCAWAKYGRYLIGSGVQRIYDRAGQVVGVEMLARPFIDQQPCSPLDLLAEARQANDHIFLDRLLRAIHLRNFSRLNNRPSTLFINHELDALIDSATSLTSRALYRKRILELGLDDTIIVVEILENEASCEKALALSSRARRVTEKELLALDDVVDSDLAHQRNKDIQPDILKLDISILQRPDYGDFISSIRSPNVKLVQEGIETEAEYRLAQQHCEYLQGFYLHRPVLSKDY